MDVKGKRLLVIGGSMATYYIVQNAQEMGIYVIVADMSDSGPAYKLADEGVLISTTDLDGLAEYVKNNSIDGIFCGPSEFNILNTMKLCEMTGLPFYATRELWDRCANKQIMKQYCEKNGLPRIPEYTFDTPEQIEQCPDDIFPVIVKPVDGCSSKGVTACTDKAQLKSAVTDALAYSEAGSVIVEKFIDNGGRQFSCSYFLVDGEPYPYKMTDTYIADPVNRKSLISAFTVTPSDYAVEYLRTTDAKTRKMLKDMGLKKGLVWGQMLPSDGNFYIHDMGYRLGGGMTYRICQELFGLNDMKMMIRLALGGPLCTPEDMEKIDPATTKGVVGQWMLPINAGTIGSIEGLDAIQKEEAVIHFIQYYREGDTVPQSVIGTLNQHCARISLKAKNKKELVQLINRLQAGISIKDTDGNEMYTMRFDTNRLLAQ